MCYYDHVPDWLSLERTSKPAMPISFNGPLRWTAENVAAPEDVFNIPVGGMLFFSDDLWGGLYFTRIGKEAWLSIDESEIDIDPDGATCEYNTAEMKAFISDTWPWKMNT